MRLDQRAAAVPTGEPAAATELCRLHKPGCGRLRQAVIEFRQHSEGCELRLVLDGSAERSELRASAGEALLLGEAWIAGLVVRGWC